MRVSEVLVDHSVRGQKIIHWINKVIPPVHFIVEMRARASAGISHIPDKVAPLNGLSFDDRGFCKWANTVLITARRVTDHDHSAEIILEIRQKRRCRRPADFIGVPMFPEISRPSCMMYAPVKG